MNRIPEIICELKQTTVAQVVRQVAVVITVLTPIWLFAGHWIEAYADDAFTNMLVRQGVSPKDFADTKKKVDEINKKTDEMSKDLDTVKNQNKELQQQGKELNNKTEETKALVEKLLDLQLRRGMPRRNPGDP